MPWVFLLETAVERELDPTALLNKIYERISTILIIKNPGLLLTR